jgi:hypothetical protein
VAKPQHAALGGRRQRVRVPSDINHVRCRGAKSFVDDLGHSRGVVLSRAVHFCDLLRLSPLTGRFVRFRRTRLLLFIYFSRVPVTVRETCVRAYVRTLRVCVAGGYGAGNGGLDAIRASAGKRLLHLPRLRCGKSRLPIAECRAVTVREMPTLPIARCRAVTVRETMT